MAWFRNYYECYLCGKPWEDEWSCTCDDDCPSCGARHASPVKSDDLTVLISEDNGQHVVLVSPETAGHYPDYEELGRFADKRLAEKFYLSFL